MAEVSRMFPYQGEIGSPMPEPRQDMESSGNGEAEQPSS